MPLPLPERPCTEWTQDAVSLPKTKNGYDSVQVFVERLIKLKHFAVTRTTDGAAELARAFVHHVVRPHGVPESIVSDRDPRLTAHYYDALSKLLGVKIKMSTARHPQSDGQSEIEIKTLVTALRAYANDHRNDWDEYVDMLELGFNCTPQASTGRAPYELLYGYKPRLPIDVALAALKGDNPAAVARAERMRDAFQFARTRLLEAQERQERNANRHRRDAAFAVGDQVLLSTEGLQLQDYNDKLCGRFIGPFTIKAVVNRNAYTLALPPQLKPLHPQFNIDKLKRYHDGNTAFPSRPRRYERPPPVATAESNGDEEWVVDRIVAQRKMGRSTQYLVAWRGYPPEENLWLPHSLVKDLEALDEWERIQNEPHRKGRRKASRD